MNYDAALVIPFGRLYYLRIERKKHCFLYYCPQQLFELQKIRSDAKSQFTKQAPYQFWIQRSLLQQTPGHSFLSEQPFPVQPNYHNKLIVEHLTPSFSQQKSLLALHLEVFDTPIPYTPTKILVLLWLNQLCTSVKVHLNLVLIYSEIIFSL